jgi:hypothetical protein
MTRITIFSVPKAFDKKFSMIQTNAILSWTHLKPKAEILLFGDEDGVSEFSKKIWAKHIPNIQTNRYKTPVLSDIFFKAQKIATYDLLMFVNADIIFPISFLSILKSLHKQFSRFLAVGQRYELTVNKSISFSKKNWSKILAMQCESLGKLKNPGWIDYFIFTKGLFKHVPPFAIGRTFWDKWLIWKALSLKIPVVDVTSKVLAIHQIHDYSYTDGGGKWVWEGAEAKKNIELAGGWSHGSTINEATYILTNSIQPKRKNLLNIFLLLKKAIDVFPSTYHVLLKIRRRKNKII